LVQSQGKILEPLVKRVLQAKLKLLCERALMQFLAIRKLLAGEEMGSPLLRLMFLPGQLVIEPLEDLKAPSGLGNLPLERLMLLSEQGVTESLMKMRSLRGQMVQPWVDLLVETLGHPQVDQPRFPLQMPD
jgi:hypothetical protein